MSIPRMKTGFDPLVGGESIQLTPFHVKLFSLVVLLLEYSIGSALSFAEHHGRHVVEQDDIKRAIKAEAMRFFDRPDLETKLDEVYTSLMEDMKHDKAFQDDDGLGSDLEEQEQAEETEESSWVVDEPAAGEIDRSIDEAVKCTCDECRAMHDVEDAWTNWNVQDDDVKTFLKAQIDSINDDFALRAATS